MIMELGDCDDGVLRVNMSCGHAFDPNALTEWCRRLLDKGHVRFYCPADAGDYMKCGREWTCVEVLRNALLTEDERAMFEEKIALGTAKQYYEFKECPGCKTFVERKDLENLKVRCEICSAKNKETWEFCWQCLRPWKDAGSGCSAIDLQGSEIKNCPSFLACPTCGPMIEYKVLCKYVICLKCRVKFCFACRELVKVCKAAKEGPIINTCSKPVAPRQTRIPVWSQRGQQPPI
ncbi:uncharacterized protein LOC144790863 [Lissotriton helveticus]